jgi:RNA polymerase sigma-70 factor, ECF subfamily
LDTCFYDYEQPPNAGAVEPEADSITALLLRLNRGDRAAFNRLMPLVYPELHRIAEGYLRRESNALTFQPTALIHEAYLRLAGYDAPDYASRKHFFVVAARVMRRVLVDHARARATAKRGANVIIPLHLASDVAEQQERIVICLDEALDALAEEDEAKARLVEMRFFAQMTPEEIAECVRTPVHRVRRWLRSAQMWLREYIEA